MSTHTIFEGENRVSFYTLTGNLQNFPLKTILEFVWELCFVFPAKQLSQISTEIVLEAFIWSQSWYANSWLMSRAITEDTVERLSWRALSMIINIHYFFLRSRDTHMGHEYNTDTDMRHDNFLKSRTQRHNNMTLENIKIIKEIVYVPTFIDMSLHPKSNHLIM